MAPAGRLSTGLFSIALLSLLFVSQARPPSKANINEFSYCGYTKGGAVLSFDDGPNAQTRGLLDVLDSLSVKAVFFVTGQQALLFPEELRETVRRGHEIGMISWNRDSFSELPLDELRWGLIETERIIQNIAGVTPVFVRPPFGALNAAARQLIRQEGYVLALWNIDTNDWRQYRVPTQMKEYIRNLFQASIRVFGQPMQSSIAQMHDGAADAGLVAFMVQSYADRNMSVISLQQCYTNYLADNAESPCEIGCAIWSSDSGGASRCLNTPTSWGCRQADGASLACVPTCPAAPTALPSQPPAHLLSSNYSSNFTHLFAAPQPGHRCTASGGNTSAGCAAFVCPRCPLCTARCVTHVATPTQPLTAAAAAQAIVSSPSPQLAAADYTRRVCGVDQCGGSCGSCGEGACSADQTVCAARVLPSYSRCRPPSLLTPLPDPEGRRSDIKLELRQTVVATFPTGGYSVLYSLVNSGPCDVGGYILRATLPPGAALQRISGYRVNDTQTLAPSLPLGNSTLLTLSTIYSTPLSAARRVTLLHDAPPLPVPHLGSPRIIQSGTEYNFTVEYSTAAKGVACSLIAPQLSSLSLVNCPGTEIILTPADPLLWWWFWIILLLLLTFCCCLLVGWLSHWRYKIRKDFIRKQRDEEEEAARLLEAQRQEEEALALEAQYALRLQQQGEEGEGQFEQLPWGGQAEEAAEGGAAAAEGDGSNYMNPLALDLSESEEEEEEPFNDELSPAMARFEVVPSGSIMFAVDGPPPMLPSPVRTTKPLPKYTPLAGAGNGNSARAVAAADATATAAETATGGGGSGFGGTAAADTGGASPQQQPPGITRQISAHFGGATASSNGGMVVGRPRGRRSSQVMFGAGAASMRALVAAATAGGEGGEVKEGGGGGGADSGAVEKTAAAAAAAAEASEVLNWEKGPLIEEQDNWKVFQALNVATGGMLEVKEISFQAILEESTADGAAAAAAADGGDGDGDGDSDSSDGEGPTRLSAAQLKSVEHEISVAQRLTHDNLVRYLGTEFGRKSFFFLRETVPGPGPLNTVLSRFGTLHTAVTIKYTRDLAQALAYLHSNGSVHGLVCGRNIRVSYDSSVKLVNYALLTSPQAVQRMAESEVGGEFGNLPWLAPEVLQRHVVTPQSDVWALGCTVIEMALGHRPWFDFNSRGSLLVHLSKTPSPPTDFLDTLLPDSGLDFIDRCVQVDPKARWTVNQLLHHPFLL